MTACTTIPSTKPLPGQSPTAVTVAPGEFITRLTATTGEFNARAFTSAPSGQALQTVTVDIGSDAQLTQLMGGWKTGTDPTPFMKCCTGAPDRSPWCAAAGLSSSSKGTCDAPMAAYCLVKSTDKACACVNSPVQNPGCLDVRCASSPAAYRLAGQLEYGASPVPQRAPCSDLNVTCEQASMLGGNLVPGYASPSCGPSRRTVALLMVVLFVLLALSLARGGGRRTKNMPPPGAAQMMGLPDLDALG